MQLYSDDSQYSHRVRFVLAEKSVNVAIRPIDLSSAGSGMHQHFSEINPRMTLPTLVDRDVVLEHPIVMLEYIEDRFPYPALLPSVPSDRAEIKERLYRLHSEMCAHADVIIRSKSRPKTEKARSELNNDISTLLPSFVTQEWCLSPNFDLLDCCIAPLLWRLPMLGVTMRQTRRTLPLLNYMHRIFKREAFLGSLTQVERDMR